MLNDAIACALGCLVQLAEDERDQRHLCLTLGTYFGCAVITPGASGHPVARAFEADDFFAREHRWPDGTVGTPTYILNARFAEQRSKDEPAYRKLVAGMVAGITQGTEEHPEGARFDSIFLGGGRAKALAPDAWADLFAAAGAPSLRVRVVHERAALDGAARAWAHEHLYGRAIEALIVTPVREPEQAA